MGQENSPITKEAERDNIKGRSKISKSQFSAEIGQRKTRDESGKPPMPKNPFSEAPNEPESDKSIE